jgi:hypothetical protein
MKRFLVLLGLIAAVAGCPSRKTARTAPRGIMPRGPTRESRYLEGFMDGYRSAHPDQPYARDEEVPPLLRIHSPRSTYDQGWRAGYHTGRKDVEQNE